MIYKQRVDHLLGPITGDEDTWKLVVPAEHRAQLLIGAHRDITSGHPEIEKPTSRLPRRTIGRGCGTKYINS